MAIIVSTLDRGEIIPSYPGPVKGYSSNQRKAEIMSHSYNIVGTGGTAADVSVEQLDQSHIKWRQTDRLADGALLATFLLDTSDPQEQVTIVVRSKDVPGKGGGPTVRQSTITLNGWAHDVDSVTGITVSYPISGGIFLNIPLMGLEVADLSVMIKNVFGLTFTTLTSKVPDTGIISKFLLGLPHLYDN